MMIVTKGPLASMPLAHFDTEARLRFVGEGAQATGLAAEEAVMGADFHLDRVSAELFGIEAMQGKGGTCQQMCLAIGATFNMPTA